MAKQRDKITVSYRILDSDGSVVDVMKRTGYSKRHLLWEVERIVDRKYGRGRMSVHSYKIVEETD